MAKAKAKQAPSIQSRFAKLDGVRLHYLAAGKGEPVILLHGYAQNSHMWRPLIAELAKTNTRHRAGSARLRPVVQAACSSRQRL